MLTEFIVDNHLHLDLLFEKYSDHTAIIGPGLHLTYAELGERIVQVAGQIQTLRLPKGSCIGLYADNPVLSLILMPAAWQAGAIFVPFDVKAPLNSLLSIVKPDILVTDQPVDGNTTVPVISPDRLLERNPQEENIQERLQPLNPDAEASVILTSGSSGTPKGVVHTIGNYIYSAWGSIDYLSMSTDDSWLLSLPLFHVGGLMIFARTMLSGAQAILPETGRDLDSTLKHHKPTFLSLVPTQLMRLLETPEMTGILQQCRGILLGGAAAPEWLIRKAFRLGVPILPTYGSTESCAQATGVSIHAPEADLLTSGKPLRFRSIRLDEDQRIIIGGKTIFKRYLHANQPMLPNQETEFKTSDIGRFDASGNLIVLGRSDQVFQSGGENINPFEIEEALLEQKGIRIAVVVPVDHPEFGQVPWAFVLGSSPFEPEPIKEALKKRLSPYKIPKEILPIPTEGGVNAMKPDRQKLVRLAAQIQKSSR